MKKFSAYIPFIDREYFAFYSNKIFGLPLKKNHCILSLSRKFVNGIVLKYIWIFCVLFERSLNALFKRKKLNKTCKFYTFCFHRNRNMNNLLKQHVIKIHINTFMYWDSKLLKVKTCILYSLRGKLLYFSTKHCCINFIFLICKWLSYYN